MSESKIERQTFSYPILFKIIFRFGNIIITPVLLVYTISLVAFLEQKIILSVPLLINLAIIYFLNLHYFKLYRILPYQIEVDEEKIICSKFFLSKKEIIIYYKEISSLSGGIFENKLSGLMKIYDSKYNVVVGFYQRLDGASKLATILLSKVDRKIYDSVLERIISGKQKVKK